MTDLEDRLRHLASSLDAGGAVDVTPPSELRAQAARRRTRRRTGVFGASCAAAVLLLVSVGVSLRTDDTGEVVAGPPVTGEAPFAADPGQRSLGPVEGVAVEVTPASDLVDGQTVRVRIDGLETLPRAIPLLCRGDVEQATVSELCDVGAVTVGGWPRAETKQEIQVPRYFWVVDPLLQTSLLVDCANEPAGCVLGIGDPAASPFRGVAVPLQFAPVAPPEVLVTPGADLLDGSEVAVEIRGLRLNRAYVFVQCTADGRVCSGEVDGPPLPSVDSGADGTARGTVVVSAALYSYRGTADCTYEPCVVGVADAEYRDRAAADQGLVATPIAFASGVKAPVPTLDITPEGPYVSSQEVTVRGTGFPPGLELGRSLGVCPAHLDTALEERCAYRLQSVVVGPDGSFRTQRVLSDLTSAGRCQDLPSGCVLAWVLNKGPIAASTPVRFR